MLQSKGVHLGRQVTPEIRLLLPCFAAFHLLPDALRKLVLRLALCWLIWSTCARRIPLVASPGVPAISISGSARSIECLAKAAAKVAGGCGLIPEALLPCLLGRNILRFAAFIPDSSGGIRHWHITCTKTDNGAAHMQACARACYGDDVTY